MQDGKKLMNVLHEVRKILLFLMKIFMRHNNGAMIRPAVTSRPFEEWLLPLTN